MAVFRRSSAEATHGTAQDSVGAKNPGAADNETVKDIPAAEAKKGRPTPKRSEAESDGSQATQGGRRSGTRTSSGTRTAAPRTPEQQARDKDRDKNDRGRRLEAQR